MVTLYIFLVELEIFGVAVQGIHQNTACIEDFLCGDDIDTVLAILRSSGYGKNSPEVFEKMATNQKFVKNTPFALQFS